MCEKIKNYLRRHTLQVAAFVSFTLVACEKIKNYLRRHTLQVVVFVVFTLVICAWYILLHLDNPKLSNPDAVAALFGALAFVAMLCALFLQRKELSLQRQELIATREELAKTAEANAKSAELAEKSLRGQFLIYWLKDSKNYFEACFSSLDEKGYPVTRNEKNEPVLYTLGSNGELIPTDPTSLDEASRRNYTFIKRTFKLEIELDLLTK